MRKIKDRTLLFTELEHLFLKELADDNIPDDIEYGISLLNFIKENTEAEIEYIPLESDALYIFDTVDTKVLFQLQYGK